MKTLNYVPDDGYTEDGFIAAIPRIHGDVRFTFRPMIAFDRSRLMRQFGELKAEESDTKLAEVLRRHIKTWNLRDADDRALPITPNTIGRLKPSLLYRLQSIAMGTEASDIDPNWDHEKRAEKVEQLIETNDGPAPIGAVQEEGDAKNSDAG